MAVFGTDSTVNTSDGSMGGTSNTWITGGMFGASAGTLTSVSFYGSRYDADFRFARLAVYQGGASDTNPAGASLIWDSGQLEITGPGAQWWTFDADDSALAANTRTWLAIRTAGNWDTHYTPAADEDTFTYNTYPWSVAVSNPATSYEATVPAVGALISSAPFKSYITYAEAGEAGNFGFAWIQA
jgi:hypothetical protein